VTPHLPVGAPATSRNGNRQLRAGRNLPSNSHVCARSVIDLQRLPFLASSHPTALGGARVAYFDKSGRRVRRPVRRRTPPADPELDDAKTRYILQVAADYPRFTPDEVYAEIYYGRRRHDITKAMVRQTLTGRRRTFAWWRFGR
jgi:hypothetical protein